MCTKAGKLGHHSFHGDPKRFEVLVAYITQNYFGKIKRIADVRFICLAHRLILP